MTRYHITRKGDPGPCRANEGNCPLGGEHFDDRQTAKQFVAENAEEFITNMRSLKKGDSISMNRNDDHGDRHLPDDRTPVSERDLNEPTFSVSADGKKEWRLESRLHRTDGPAVEWPDGTKEWYQNGVLHREDGPAVEDSEGVKEWWVNGKQHRTDGPAVELSNGAKEWWVDGKLHREDGPAVEWSNELAWYQNGVPHRTDGPAVEGSDGSRQWWVNGERRQLEDQER